MKLNTKDFRYLAAEDWRVLTGVELGSKNHEVIPTPLIIQLSGLRAGNSGVQRSISTLAKAGLIAREKNIKYDGYRLTYGGLDYLALHGHTKSNAIVHIGSQMGVGKESDIYLVTTPDYSIPSLSATSSTLSLPLSNTSTSQQQPAPVQAILKLHRLGRTSFRNVRNKRSYHGNRSHASWLYLSRLSAHKEFLCMRALYDGGFPVPKPISWNRHAIVMSLVPGVPLRQVPLSAFELAAGGRRAGKEKRDAEIARLYGQLMEMVLKLAEVGVIHGDFNEFNILIENVPDPAKYEEEEEEDEELDQAPVPNSQAEPVDLLDHPTTPSSEQDSRSHLPATDTNIDTTTTPSTQAPSPQSTTPTGKPTNSHPRNTTTTTTPSALPLPTPMKPHLIDFPQITSLSHPQASFFFTRDIDCIKRFFFKRYHFESSDSGPTFQDAEARLQGSKKRRLDVDIEAAGFSRKMAKELGRYHEEVGEVVEGEGESDGEDEDGEDIQDDEGVDGVDAEVALEAQRDLVDVTEDDENDGNVTKTDDFHSPIDKRDESEVDEFHNQRDFLNPALTSVLRADTRTEETEVTSNFDQMSMTSSRMRPRTQAKVKAGWSI